MKRIFWLFSLCFLNSCLPPEHSSSLSSKTPSPGFLTQPTTVCYPTETEPASCFPSIPLSEIDGRSKQSYLYKEPLPENHFPPSQDPLLYRPPSHILQLDNTDPLSPLIPQYFHLSQFMDIQKGAFALYSRPVLLLIKELKKSIGSSFQINSAYRSPGYNAQLPGAAQWSRHTYGDAIDFFSDEKTLEEQAQLCIQLGASFYQVYKKHVHCDWRGLPKDPAFFENSQSLTTFSTIILRMQQHTSLKLLSHKNKKTDFKVIHPPQEDPGQLVYIWKLKKAPSTSQKFVTFKPHLSIKNLPSGHYLLQVSVGLSLTKEVQFNIP